MMNWGKQKKSGNLEIRHQISGDFRRLFSIRNIVGNGDKKPSIRGGIFHHPQEEIHF